MNDDAICMFLLSIFVGSAITKLGRNFLRKNSFLLTSFGTSRVMCNQVSSLVRTGNPVPTGVRVLNAFCPTGALVSK